MVRLAMYEKNAKAQAICESDETDKLEELITDFMSDSNDTCSDAKSIFEICINKPNPDVFANKLYHVLSSSLDHNSCTISAILLRKILINKFEPPFLSFPVETQLTLKRKFLELVDTSVDTPTRPINKELCRTVSALAASLLPTKEWPEFLSFLSKLVTSDKKRAWLIGAHLTQYLGKRLKELYSVNLEKELHSVLLQCLTEGEGEDVRIAVWGAAINFILCLEQKDLVNFQDLLTAMMSTLKNALCSGNETIADAVHTLKLLINLAGMKPTSLRKQIVEMVKTILLMADDHSLEKETRRLAIDFVLTLIQFVLTLADVEKTNRGLLKLGMEFEINMELWEFDEETVNYGLWQRCVDGMLILWDRKDILTVALEVLPAYLDAPEWQKKHAAFIVLTQSIKSCLETQVKIENLEQVVPMVLSPFPNAHRLVRCAAIEAIQQFLTHLLCFRLHEEVMRTNFEQVMPMLLSLFQDDDPVVQNASILAIEKLARDFSKHLQVGCHVVLPAFAKVMNDSPNQDVRVSGLIYVLLLYSAFELVWDMTLNPANLFNELMDSK